MSKLFFSFLVVVFIITNLGCASTSKVQTMNNDKELKSFAELLTGNFSNIEQANADTNFFHISLVMTPIWPDRTDGIWIYVEQAMATKLDKPYRQRVYRLTHPEQDVFQSDIYTIAEPLLYAGLQNDINKMSALTFDKIDLKEGCEVRLRRKGKIYVGGTDGAKCPSDLRGASYATTQITLKKGELVSWDQGFDTSGRQVWGSTLGGYIFKK
jgi:hypothetical protein